jgi:hypothetical protein
MVTDNEVGFGPDFIWYHPRPRPSAMMLRVGLGIFILFFLDEGRAGRNDLIGAAFKKQCPLCGPQGFHSRYSEFKNQNARQDSLT